MIDQLRFKLETKDFENAKLYFDLRDYKASATAFKNVLTDYPATHYKEEAMFLILKSNYLLAVNSVDKKKHERYTQAILAYGEFKDSFTSGKYIKEAGEILDNCRKAVDKLSKTNS